MENFSTQISRNRTKYKTKDESAVVPRLHELLINSWIDADDFSSNEICNNEITEYKMVGKYENNKGLKYVVKPDKCWCSCGEWQDNLFPCIHACTYLKQELNISFEDMLNNHVSRLYKYGSLQDLYKDNIRTVMIDNIKIDGETNPPSMEMPM